MYVLLYHLYVTGHSVALVLLSRSWQLSPKVGDKEALHVGKNGARNFPWGRCRVY